jgi:hypothetical protein
MPRFSSLTKLIVAAAIGAAALYPQSADTGFLGTVADSTGAVVAGASVVLTQPATGAVRNVTTSATGGYEVRYLMPGEYTVEVRNTGFRSEKSSVITLRIGQTVRLDFTLQVGEVNEQVQVNAQGVMLETQSGVMGGVVTQDNVVNLPLNGRNFIQLGNLTPGVISSGGTTSGSFRANGARSGYQQISFDGVTAVNNRATNEFMFPSVDAVQEFKVQSSNYSAEYGGHAGANVQLQLRSGANQFHGTAFDYLRNDVLDARGFFRPAPLQKPTLRRNQYGGVLSGPIVRDKTFFMGSYEGLKERRSTAGTTSVPTLAQRGGDLSGLGTITDPLSGAPFTGSVIPQNRLNAAGGQDSQREYGAAEFTWRDQQLRGSHSQQDRPGSVHGPYRPHAWSEGSGIRALHLSWRALSFDQHQSVFRDSALSTEPERGGTAFAHVRFRQGE